MTSIRAALLQDAGGHCYKSGGLWRAAVRGHEQRTAQFDAPLPARVAVRNRRVVSARGEEWNCDMW